MLWVLVCSSGKWDTINPSILRELRWHRQTVWWGFVNLRCHAGVGWGCCSCSGMWAFWQKVFTMTLDSKPHFPGAHSPWWGQMEVQMWAWDACSIQQPWVVWCWIGSLHLQPPSQFSCSAQASLLFLPTLQSPYCVPEPLPSPFHPAALRSGLALHGSSLSSSKEPHRGSPVPLECGLSESCTACSLLNCSQRDGHSLPQNQGEWLCQDGIVLSRCNCGFHYHDFVWYQIIESWKHDVGIVVTNILQMENWASVLELRLVFGTCSWGSKRWANLPKGTPFHSWESWSLAKIWLMPPTASEWMKGKERQRFMSGLFPCLVSGLLWFPRRGWRPSPLGYGR